MPNKDQSPTKRETMKRLFGLFIALILLSQIQAFTARPMFGNLTFLACR